MLILDKLCQEYGRPAMEPTAQLQNNIFHDKDRIILSIAISSGVNLTFSLSDDDLEQLVEQRRAYRKSKQAQQLLIPGRN